MTYPTFNNGEPLPASDLNAIGMWLVKTQTIGSGVTSVVVSNAFSADYDNYRIIVSGVSSNTGGISLRMQLNNSTGSTYLIGGIYAAYGTTTLNGYGPPATTLWTDILAQDTVTQAGVIDMYQPFQTARTSFTSQSIRTGTGQNAWYYMTGIDTNAVSNTGFTISPVAGNISGGTIRVYGYRN